MKLPEEQREELLKRIERKLIINESQLSEAHFRPEKTEARGLDYAGKANILKQAIASGSLVEVTWPHPELGTSRTLGLPEALEKSGADSVLVFKPHGGNTAVLRIPIAKISLLRRIKKSIYSE
jgi:hypothetical protein